MAQHKVHVCIHVTINVYFTAVLMVPSGGGSTTSAIDRDITCAGSLLVSQPWLCIGGFSKRKVKTIQQICSFFLNKYF